MSLTTISGEIQAQPLNDNFSYLNEQLTNFSEIYVNVKNKGAVGDGVTNDTTAFTDAVSELKAAGGGTLYVPFGNYNASVTIDDNNITLLMDNSASILGRVNVSGTGFTKSNTVQLVGSWANFSAGKTVFSGDFTAYSSGDKVIIETSVEDASFNQIGIDLDTVVSATSTSLTLTLGTKFQYYNPIISKLSNARYVTGSITANTHTLSGDYTALLSVGDIVRIENRNGTGGVESSPAYFEINKVVAIDSTTVTFENRFTHSFTDYWLVKLSYISNINISGGKINTLYTQYVENFYYAKGQTGISNDGYSYTLSLRYLYDFIIEHLDVEIINKPIGFDSVYCVNGILSDIVSSGARGSTDNGNIKIMSGNNIVLDTIVSTDTESTSSESITPIMFDYYYTPYKVWCNKISIDSVTCSGNKNTSDLAKPDFWMIGVKNSTANNIECNNPIRITKSDSLICTALVNNSILNVDDNSNIVISDFKAGSINITGSNNCIISKGFLNGNDAVSSRIIYVHGTCSKLNIKDININASINTSIYLQDVDDIYIENIADSASGTYSVEHGTGVTNARYGVNYFNAAFPFNSSAISATKHYGIQQGTIMPLFISGRNGYTNKGYITGDGTEYQTTWDGDGVSFYNKNTVFDQTTFTVPLSAGGRYLFYGSIGLSGVSTLNTIGELYIKVNGTTSYYLDYKNIKVTAVESLYLNGTTIVNLTAGSTVTLCTKVSGTSAGVTWGYNDFGGHFSGQLMFVQ